MNQQYNNENNAEQNTDTNHDGMKLKILQDNELVVNIFMSQ